MQTACCAVAVPHWVVQVAQDLQLGKSPSLSPRSCVNGPPLRAPGQQSELEDEWAANFREETDVNVKKWAVWMREQKKSKKWGYKKTNPGQRIEGRPGQALAPTPHGNAAAQPLWENELRHVKARSQDHPHLITVKEETWCPTWFGVWCLSSPSALFFNRQMCCCLRRSICLTAGSVRCHFVLHMAM